MRNFLTLFVCLLIGFSAQAQNDFPLQFVDKDGQIIPDGTILDITDFEEDEIFGDILMPANVWVKNISNETVQGGASYTIQTINNGWFQTCFPAYCMRQSIAGAYTTGIDTFSPSQFRDMQTEWLPESDGVCMVVYQLLTYRKLGNNYMPDGDGPTIHLNFYYGAATGINNANSDKQVCSTTYYDLSGQRTDHPHHGIYLKRTTYADGTIKVQKTLIH